MALFYFLFSFWFNHHTEEGRLPVIHRNVHHVTVVNGYGSGLYRAGDTVHIFSDAIKENEIFEMWTGEDVSLLNSKDEWHTWFVMPDRDMTFNNRKIIIDPFELKFEQIKGRDRLKPVYYFFPDRPVGVVYLLHGTMGTARNLVTTFEWKQLIKALGYYHFGIIVTESEESTLRKDLNNDGKIRWQMLPLDKSENVDYANLIAITQAFENRGIIDKGLPHYSVGMSNGGAFSTVLAMMNDFRAAVSYCAPSGARLAALTSVPVLFCMAGHDANPAVGAKGNAEALSNSQVIAGRGICSRYLVKPASPLYAERFARSGEITLKQSLAIFNELKANGYLDDRNYIKGDAASVTEAMNSRAGLFPSLRGLTPALRHFVNDQILLSASDHKMFSDFTAATIRFLRSQCANPS